MAQDALGKRLPKSISPRAQEVESKCSGDGLVQKKFFAGWYLF